MAKRNKDVAKRLLIDFEKGISRKKTLSKYKITSKAFSQFTSYLRSKGHNIVKDEKDFFKLVKANSTKEGKNSSAPTPPTSGGTFWERALEVFKQGASLEDAMKALKVPKVKVHAIKNYLKRKGYTIAKEDGLFVVTGESEPIPIETKSSNKLKFTAAQDKLFQNLSLDDKEIIYGARKTITFNQKIIQAVFEAKQETLNLIQGI